MLWFVCAVSVLTVLLLDHSAVAGQWLTSPSRCVSCFKQDNLSLVLKYGRSKVCHEKLAFMRIHLVVCLCLGLVVTSNCQINTCFEAQPCDCNPITKQSSDEIWQLRDISICKTIGMQPVVDGRMYAPLVPVTEACPRYIYTQISTVAGLGHRIQNWMAAHTLSISLNLTIVYGGGFAVKGNHLDSYPEAEQIFGTHLFVSSNIFSSLTNKSLN